MYIYSYTASEGNSLGLAIAETVCDVHQWDIRYDFVSGSHLFTVVQNGMIQKWATNSSTILFCSDIEGTTPLL